MQLNPTLKKVLLVLLLVSVVIGLGTLMFVLFLASPPSIEDTDVTTDPTGINGLAPSNPGSGFNLNINNIFDSITDRETPSIPNIAQGGQVLTAQLTTSAIVSPVIVNGNQVQFYEPNDGKFYAINPAGEIESISDAVFPQAETVTFSDNGSVAAIEFPDGTNIVYNFDTEKQTTLPSHWDEFDFSPEGDSLISKSYGVSNDLVVTNSDGTQARVIADMGSNSDEVKLNWSPNNETVAFSETGNAQSVFGRQEIYLIDDTGEAAGRLIVDGTNFSAKWSPSGNSLLYSVADQARNERPSLWFANSSGDQIGSGRRNLQLETWVEKCTFKDEVTVICAVPREVPDYSGADARFVTEPDDVYQVNVTSGRVSLIGSPVSDLKMFNLQLSQDQSSLFFTDEFGQLHSMRLK